MLLSLYTDSTGGDCVKPAYRGVPALSHNPVEAVRTSLRALHPVAVLKIKKIFIINITASKSGLVWNEQVYSSSYNTSSTRSGSIYSDLRTVSNSKVVYLKANHKNLMTQRTFCAA
jgi:hypothetical protein